VHRRHAADAGRVARALVVLALGIPLFGWIDLTATWGLDEDTTTWDLAYGGLTGIMLPVAFVVSAPVMAIAGAGGHAVAGLWAASSTRMERRASAGSGDPCRSPGHARSSPRR
jgi:hypothetical protein